MNQKIKLYALHNKGSVTNFTIFERMHIYDISYNIYSSQIFYSYFFFTKYKNRREIVAVVRQ